MASVIFGSNRPGSSPWEDLWLDDAAVFARRAFTCTAVIIKMWVPLWQVMGECTRNPEYMLSYCRLSCGACAKNETRADAGDGATELRR